MSQNEIFQELSFWIDEFEKQFNQLPSTRQILKTHSPEHLIESIKKCLETGINNIPDIYGYRDLPADDDC